MVLSKIMVTPPVKSMALSTCTKSPKSYEFLKYSIWNQEIIRTPSLVLWTTMLKLSFYKKKTNKKHLN